MIFISILQSLMCIISRDKSVIDFIPAVPVIIDDALPKKKRSVIEVTHWLVEQVSCHECNLVGFIRTGMIGFINLDLPLYFTLFNTNSEQLGLLDY